MVDPGFNAILLRSIQETAELAEELGEHDIAAASKAQLEKGLAALETLWNDDIGQYTCYDRVTGELSSVPSVGESLRHSHPSNQNVRPRSLIAFPR